MRYPAPAGVSVKRNGVVRRGDVVLGVVRHHCSIWVKRYKTVPDKYLDGWVATPASLDAPAAQFHKRRDAVDWLADPEGYPCSDGRVNFPRRVVECERDKSVGS